jgi:hypothetical protein
MKEKSSIDWQNKRNINPTECRPQEMGGIFAFLFVKSKNYPSNPLLKPA